MFFHPTTPGSWSLLQMSIQPVAPERHQLDIAPQVLYHDDEVVAPSSCPFPLKDRK